MILNYYMKGRCDMTGEQRYILDALIDFAEENWTAFSALYEERTWKEIDKETVSTMTQI